MLSGGGLQRRASPDYIALLYSYVMQSRDGAQLDALSVRLLVNGSRFSRSISRHTSGGRSLVAMRVLANLTQSGPLRVGELASRELITQPAMTGAVNRLAADGLVRRAEDREDGRASLVELTPAGTELLIAFRAEAAAIARPAMTTLSAQDVEVLDRAATLLESLATAIDSP